jgi:hypothetical protein
MATEAWIRNPGRSIKECADTYQRDLTFYWPYVVKHKLDPLAFVSTHYGVVPWRVMWIQETEAFEWNSYSSDPAVHPVWSYGERLVNLKAMCASHEGGYVIVDRWPDLNLTENRKAFRSVVDVQNEYPNVKVYMHNLYSYRWAFGSGLAAADIEVTEAAYTGNVYLPNGKRINFEEAELRENQHWIKLVGMRRSKLSKVEDRIKFNILSARWAGENFREAVKFRVRNFEAIDPLNPQPARAGNIYLTQRKAQEGDYFYCDDCSLSDVCKYYRSRSMCQVPGSRGKNLADKFASADAQNILDAMGDLVALGAERLEALLNQEEQDGHIHAQVDRQIKDLFDQAKDLAKLTDPRRFSPAAANAAPQVALPQGTPAELMGGVMAKLEAAGIPRNRITPAMIDDLLKMPMDKHEAFIGQQVKELSA